MSARDLLVPRFAFGGRMEHFNRRIRAMERRSMWPSAVQSAYNLIDTADWLTVQNVAAGDFPRGGMTEAVSLTLDPGRWILHGLASQWFEVRGANPEMGLVLGWETASSSGDRLSFTRKEALSTGLERLYRLTSTALEVRTTEQITAKVSLYIGVEAGYTDDSSHAESAQILAFPG